MTALAAQADVEQELGRTLTTGEEGRLTAALNAASRTVRTVTGRRYEAGTFTVKRRVRDGRVILDSPSSVDTVEVVNFDGTADELTDWTLRGDTVYGISCGGWVEVTYTVDAPTPPATLVPAEVVEVCAAMAARKLTVAVPEGATSYTVTRGPFTESAEFDESHDSVDPTAAEVQTLMGYALRRPGPLTSL